MRLIVRRAGRRGRGCMTHLFALPTGLLIGSSVLTLRGEFPAEAIEPGDLLVGVSASSAPYAPLRRSRVVTHDLRVAPWARPLRIRAEALEPGQPMSDLLVAPGQLLFLDGALVPAWRLADGIGIAAEPDLAEASYVRLALEHHNVVLADGMGLASDPCMQDAGPAQALCAPLLDDMALGRLRACIRLRAEEAGWAPPLPPLPPVLALGTGRARLLASTARLAAPGPDLPDSFPSAEESPAAQG